MKDNKELTIYLDEYLKMDKPQFALERYEASIEQTEKKSRW